MATVNFIPRSDRTINIDIDDAKLEGITPILFGAAAFQHLNAGCEVGLFDLLARRPGLRKDEIGKELGLQPRATDILLLGTTALRLTDKTGGAYYNCGAIEQMFNAGSWDGFKAIVAFEQYVVYEGQVDNTDSLRTNSNVGLRRIRGTGRDLYHRLSENPDLERHFYTYMRSWSELSNPLLIKNVDFTRHRKVIDAGGGDAVNAIALAKAFPHLEITVLEIAGTVPIARGRIAAAGLSERVKVVECDMFAHDFPKGHDCVLFSHQLVIWTPQENIGLLRRAFDALDPGGEVVVFNSISDNDGNGPLMAALDSVYFAALPAEGGMIYSYAQYEGWLRESGFRDITSLRCGGWTPHGIVRGNK
jgi:ubiquinone/menaquinone biosynthesis C-methylase UbiE